MILHLFPNGSVEVGTAKPTFFGSSRPGFRWVRAYSEATENGFTNPLTRNHWYSIARRDGVKLKFHDTEAAARAATIKQAKEQTQ